MLATFPPAALALLALALVSGLVLLFLLADRSGHGEGRPGLAVSTDPISLYVVDDGEVEERRSGVAPAWSPDGEQLAYKATTTATSGSTTAPFRSVSIQTEDWNGPLTAGRCCSRETGSASST